MIESKSLLQRLFRCEASPNTDIRYYHMMRLIPSHKVFEDKSEVLEIFMMEFVLDNLEDDVSRKACVRSRVAFICGVWTYQN